MHLISLGSRPDGVVVKTKPGTVGQARCATLQSQWKFSSGGEAALLLVLARLPHLVTWFVARLVASVPSSPFLLGFWFRLGFRLWGRRLCWQHVVHDGVVIGHEREHRVQGPCAIWLWLDPISYLLSALAFAQRPVDLHASVA